MISASAPSTFSQRITLRILLSLLVVWPVLISLPGSARAVDDQEPVYEKGSLILGPYLLLHPGGFLQIRWETFGESKGGIELQAPDGTSHWIPASLLPASEETIRLPGRMYAADLTELTPCNKYEYRLVPFQGKGEKQRFTAPPHPGSLCEDGLRFVVYGDSRGHHRRHAKVAEQIQRASPHLVLNVGDIVDYARQTSGWQMFFKTAAQVLRSAPILFAPGNHEKHRDPSFGAAMIARYFRGPGHHSVDFGSAHFVVLDLYFGRALDGSGKRWLENDLSEVSPDTPVFVILHNPVYSFGKHSISRLVRSLRPPFRKYRVTAVFAGHAHIYEHFHIDGTHYLTLGGGGTTFHKTRVNVVKEQEKFLVETGRFHHFLLGMISNDTIHFQVVNTDTSEVADEWQMPKGRPIP